RRSGFEQVRGRGTENQVDRLFGREQSCFGAGFRRGVGSDPARESTTEDRVAALPQRGRRRRQVASVGGEAHEDQLASGAGSKRLREGEELVEPSVVVGEDENRAQRVRLPGPVLEVAILAEDRLLELTQGRRRLDSQLVHERLTRAPVDVERLGLAAG